MNLKVAETAPLAAPDFLAAFLRPAGPGSRFAPPEEGGLVWTTPICVAGFRFHQGPEVLELLRAGDSLQLRGEPENPHDARAVRIEWLGLHIGYIPRVRNAMPSFLLNQGIRVDAHIRVVDRQAEPWEAVQVELSVEGRSLGLASGADFA